MAWYDVLFGATPAGVASSTAKAVTDSLFGGVDRIIRDFKAPPEAILQLETLRANIELQITQGILADTASARGMQTTTNSWVPPFLALFYTAAFVLLSAAILAISFLIPDLTLNAFQAGMVGSIWGALGKEAAQGSNFYLGSSSGSADKSDTIAQMATETLKIPVKPGAPDTTGAPHGP